MSAPTTPSLVQNPSLDRWIRVMDDGSVRIATGKVEIGQGIVTAIGQIAAEELDLRLDQVTVLSGSSRAGPDERYTTSSLSIQESGASVRLVCATIRDRMLNRLAQRLNCARDELSVRDGEMLRSGEATGYDYWRLAPEVDLLSPIVESPALKAVALYSIVGQNVPRTDLPAKVQGAAFVHDMVRPDMVHARTLRQPGRGATLASLDEAAVRKAAGGALDVIRIGSFVGFLSADEAVVDRAAVAAGELARWNDLKTIEPGAEEAAWLVNQPSADRMLGAAAPVTAFAGMVEGTFSRAYVAHASMAPSCALAEYRERHLTVWSHGQGMHPLQRTLAQALKLPPESITTHHVQGAGCYGHNGADDAALDAALLAMERPGQCVRLQWRRDEEFAFEPCGPSMQVTVRVGVDDAGAPVDWTTEIWSGVHVQRPGLGGGNLLAAEALPEPAAAPEVSDPPEERGGGATRNAVPLYDVAAHRIVHHLIPNTPIRTSALRGLGAVPNVFAIEAIMDELAARAGTDPIEYRLSLISDPRAERLLRTVAARANWSARGPGGNGRGLGVGIARYKNTAAYAAIVAAVSVEQDVRVERVWCVADAGLVINPDGARNQLEGGIVQSTSWTVKEQVRLGQHGIRSLDWDSYPILRFHEVPLIESELVEASEHPSLGVGECTVAPTAAAIGNAVAHALGTRLHHLPLTRERIVDALV